MKPTLSALLLTLLALASGCSGIRSRIKENERQFLEYPPETQAQIQSGRVDLGFTEEMVYIAKGKPANKETIERKDANGKSHRITVWKYGRTVPAGPAMQTSSSLSQPYGYPQIGPGPAQPAPIYYEKAFAKIEFENGKVIRWDPELQKD